MQAATPKPYDATLPVDLAGTPGVTLRGAAGGRGARHPHAAGAAPVRRLRRRSSRAGTRSATARPRAVEHFINWPLIDDGKILDPDAPETLVFRDEANGQKTLVAAMFS